jgi:hypothetical protein
MRLLPALLLAAFLGDAPQNSPQDLVLMPLPDMGKNLKLWLPRAYAKDPLIGLKFSRYATTRSNETLHLRMALLEQKLPVVPLPPTEADLLKVDPSLTYVKFTGSVENWRGRPVPTGRYEGFVPENIGVYGRVVWLPLEPGTVVLDLYGEPPWVDAMNRDWDLILENLSGPVVEHTLKERAPKRWLTAVILGSVGIFLTVVGVLMIVVRMNEALGGSLTFLGLFLPIVPVGYGLLHLDTCWRGLSVVLGGLGILGLALLLSHGG